MAMAMACQPLFLPPRTKVRDFQVRSAANRPKHPPLQIFFDPKISFVNLNGYLPQSSVHRFQTIAKNLTPIGLERIVIHVHWGSVEREHKQYNWKGYRELLSLAKAFKLKVKVILGFHHHREGIEGATGAKDWEYISFSSDELQLLKGRSPLEVYDDFMASFANTFSSSLGHTITDIEIGLGPRGELRFPFLLKTKRDSFGEAKSHFACFDKHMVQGAYRRREAVLRSVAKRDPEARDLFLQWYSKMLIGHGDKVLQKARLRFSKSSVNISGRLAPMYYGYCTVKDCELIAGYSDYIGIMEMLSKNKCGICVPSFDLKENEWWVKKVIAAAGEFQVPIVGENSGNTFDQKSFKQMKTISNLCRAHIEEPFSFNIAVDERFQYSWDRFTMFYNFVESMSA